MTATFKKKLPGLLACLALAVPAWALGRRVPLIGGAVIAILAGMVIALAWKEKGSAAPGIKFTSKYILQAAVVLLGFGMDLHVVLATGRQSLPIILCTIATALVLAYALHRLMKIPSNISTLVGVGSSICGGSAIAATAPVLDADDDEVAQAISVIFFFNVLAAILFPILGRALGLSTTSGEAFGIFAGTAVNDTSSVTAAAATWDSMWNLGSATLDKAVTVKLTRTLAIIPITFGLALYRQHKRKASAEAESGEAMAGKGPSLRRSFPLFILFFLFASVLTTVSVGYGLPTDTFLPLKELSKFLIVMAMGAIGLSSDLIKLVKTGGKPIVLGAVCWIGITVVSLIMQRMTGLW